MPVLCYSRLMSNISATEFMESFSGGQEYAPAPEPKADPRGEPVEQWDGKKFVTRLSKTGQEVSA